MVSRRYTERVPLSVIEGDADGELSVTFSYEPGTPETGRGYMADPGKYDPGSKPELHIEAASYVVRDHLICCGLAPHERERITEHLLDTWEPPDDEPDWDRLRDQRIDERLTDGN